MLQAALGSTISYTMHTISELALFGVLVITRDLRKGLVWAPVACSSCMDPNQPAAVHATCTYIQVRIGRSGARAMGQQVGCHAAELAGSGPLSLCPEQVQHVKDPSGIVRSPWTGFGTLEILTAREVDALHDKDDLARQVVSVAASMAVAPYVDADHDT